MSKRKVLVEIELETEVGNDYLTSAVKGAILHHVGVKGTTINKIDVKTYNE